MKNYISTVGSPEFEKDLDRKIERLLHKHANWAHQAIHEQDEPLGKRSFIYSPLETADTVVTKYELRGIIARAVREAKREELRSIQKVRSGIANEVGES